MSEALHQQDFYAWTQEQAAALRARRTGANDIDYERVAEEIEEMGSEVRHACEAYTALILTHLFKLASTRSAYPVEHWRSEIGTFRLNLLTRLTPTIRNGLVENLEDLHGRGAKQAAKSFRNTEPDIDVDGSLRWTWEEITGDSDDDPVDRDYPGSLTG